MLPSIDSSRKTLSNVWLAMSFMSALTLGLFIWPLSFALNITTPLVLAVWGGGTCAGLAAGIYISFRSRSGTAHALYGFCYLFVVLDLMPTGGGLLLLVQVVGRPDTAMMALWTNLIVMLLSLSGGMYNEAKRLGVWKDDSSGNWRKWLERNIDYTTNQVIPTFSAARAGGELKGTGITSPFWIVAIGTTNIPLLFEIYGGGRANAVFLAAPVLMGTLAYINIKNLGPALLRVLLLRKLENEHGCRFQNADYEQIQELRRGFFLARWLMKDYRPPKPPGDTETSLAPSSKDLRKRKRRR